MPAESLSLALVMRCCFLWVFMFVIGWFHCYLRNPERRISKNVRFFWQGGTGRRGATCFGMSWTDGSASLRCLIFRGLRGNDLLEARVAAERVPDRMQL